MVGKQGKNRTMLRSERHTEAMKLYLLRGDLDFHWLRPVDEAPWPWRGGVPVAQSWQEPSLTTSDEDDANEFLPVDCLPMNTGSDGPILSDYAKCVLEALLLPAGELWPVRVLGHRYWWFNCLARIDALDPDQTDADWDEVEGDWGSFRWISSPRTLEFRSEVVASAPVIFRVPEFPQGVLFGGEQLSQAIEEFGLTGFRLDSGVVVQRGWRERPCGFRFWRGVRRGEAGRGGAQAGLGSGGIGAAERATERWAIAALVLL